MFYAIVRTFRNPKTTPSVIPTRFFANLSVKYDENPEAKSRAWQIHSYGGLEDLKLSNVRIPVISKPNEVLVKIDASSVNPIDVAMARGYGSTIFNFMRKTKNLNLEPEIEFPLTLGRDFSGTIVSKGHGVGDRIKLGDEVWGVVPIDRQGCHANYVTVDSCLVNPRPQNISSVEAASILYAGLTAWSALWITGGLCYKIAIPARINRRVLVLGGSGGVGTLAIQLLKAWNSHVITTCSSDAVNMLIELGADVVIDYKEDSADDRIVDEGPYDIILDCCQQGPDTIKEKGYPHKTYITLNSPLLKNVDQHGLIGGTVKNIGDLVKYNIPSRENKSSVRWGFFTPSRAGINMIQELVESGQILPVIHKTYSFEDLPKAYERVAEGHLRGKHVIDMKQ
ncbi:reticulon-4-interacting protein 1, mitochondrial [Venturia canescens]|uniref:reticulon-4-interacting protein 1, mitochondrial n=1 Tax=Venturia canescens TaxID=32260 RepID=UPI001C9C29D4|nr:reticulon-4-interacting protein 1, mitochondrial [Venturia canescens]